jgi:hypothetical protein
MAWDGPMGIKDTARRKVIAVYVNQMLGTLPLLLAIGHEMAAALLSFLVSC